MQNSETIDPLLEACVETYSEARLAEKKGAHRIELCANLDVGGLTPSRELIEDVVLSVKIPVMVMVRPRAGNFTYTYEEVEEMKKTIVLCKALGAAGLVFGVLTSKQLVDAEITGELCSFAHPLPVTFHKAIDETPDPVAAVQVLVNIPGIRRILTSGGAATAMEGKAVIKKMMVAAGDAVTILAAGRVTLENLQEVHHAIGAREYHGRRIVF